MSTINTILIKRRLEGSPLNNVPSLSGGELAYSEKNHTLYYGGEFGTLTIAGSGAFVDVLNTQTISGPKTFTGSTTLSSATFSSNSIIDFGGNVLTNLATPVTGSDAATKEYVDAFSSSAVDSLSAEIYNTFVEKIESEAVVLNGGLTVSSGIDADTLDLTGDAVIGGSLTITQNLSVLGTQVVVNTETINISGTSTQIDVVNNGTATGLTVNQTGNQDVAEFKDDGNTALIIKGGTADGGFVGIGTATPNEKLTVTGNISATGTIYSDGGMEISSGGATTLYVEDGKIGVNTETPNEALTVVGDISASADIHGVDIYASSVTTTGLVNVGTTLDVTGAATFASSVSAQGALTVDGTATFNNDAVVVDKLQVQSTDWVVSSSGTRVEIEGTNIKVTEENIADTTYGLNGINAIAVPGDYTIATTGAAGDVVISSNSSANDINLNAASVNLDNNLAVTGTSSLDNGAITTNGSGDITGTAGSSELINFIIDGGSF